MNEDKDVKNKESSLERVVEEVFGLTEGEFEHTKEVALGAEAHDADEEFEEHGSAGEGGEFEEEVEDVPPITDAVEEGLPAADAVSIHTARVTFKTKMCAHVQVHVCISSVFKLSMIPDVRDARLPW